MRVQMLYLYQDKYLVRRLLQLLDFIPNVGVFTEFVEHLGVQM